MIRQKLLFLSAHLPSQNVPQAGHKTAFELLQGYAGDHEVYLITFINEEEKEFFRAEELDFCREVHIFPLDRWKRISAVIRHPFLPNKVALRAFSGVERRIREILSRVTIDVVHFEFTAASYYHDLFPPRVRKIVDEVDVSYQMVNRRMTSSFNPFVKLYYLFEQKRQKWWELDVLSGMQSIIVQNEKDRAILVKDGIEPERIKVITPYVSSFGHGVSRNKIEKRTMLFWGAMHRSENYESVVWFIKKIFPRIRRRYVDAKLYVVGAKPPDKLKALASANIEVTGFVDDPAPYFEKCQLAVAPLILGAGVKVKVLECLGAGLTVVSTSIGAEGITHKSLIVRDTPKEFAAAVLEIFDETESA